MVTRRLWLSAIVLNVEIDTIVVHKETMMTFGMIPTRSGDARLVHSWQSLASISPTKLYSAETKGEEVTEVRQAFTMHCETSLTQAAEFTRGAG